MYPVLRFLVRIDIVPSPFYHLIYIWITQPAPNDAEKEKAAVVMTRIGTKLFQQTKEKSSHRKDVLSILVRANTMEDKAHQMKDEDVISRTYKPILECIYSYTLRDSYFYRCWS